MHIVLVTDAWLPQVNGVVTTLVELVRHVRLLGHEVTVIEPSGFRTRPCPGYEGIDLAVFPGREMYRQFRNLKADAVHIATEGPLGWAARRECKRRGIAFTTAFHTRFPEVVEAAIGIPSAWGYALLRRFHSASAAVMVPTRGMSRFLRERRFERLVDWTHGVDTDLFAFHETPTVCERLGRLARPVSLYVGRVSYEKNVQAFLEMDIPGSKVVCGEGPLRQRLQDRFPGAHWLGVLPRQELAKVYASADVLVFPSPNETFGLVMVEAMATGTPVAALPVEGPTEVIGDSGAGALNLDLMQAWGEALKCSRIRARQRAEQFSWRAASHLFLASLVPAGPQHRTAVLSTRMSGRAQRSAESVE